MERRSVLTRGLAMLWERPSAYALVAILPHVVTLGLLILIGRLIVRLHPLHVDPVNLWDSMGWKTRLLTILAMIAVATVPTYVAARGVCRLALEQQREVDISLGAVLGEMLRFVPIAVLYFMVFGIVTFLGGLLLVVPGLLIASSCALIIPAGIDCRLGPLAAIRRGFSLVRRVFGRVLGIYATCLVFVVVGRVVLILFLAFAGDEGPAPIFPFAVLMILWLLAIWLALALMHIMFTLLYCEAREMDAAAPSAAAVADPVSHPRQ
jgi:hypothetical protein